MSGQDTGARGADEPAPPPGAGLLRTAISAAAARKRGPPRKARRVDTEEDASPFFKGFALAVLRFLFIRFASAFLLWFSLCFFF